MNELKSILNETPGMGIAAVGFGICMVLREATVLSASRSIPLYNEVALFMAALTVSLLLMALIYWRRKTLSLYRHPFIAVIITSSICLSAFLSFGQFFKTAIEITLVNSVFQISVNLLFLLWAELLYPYGFKRIAYITALACVVSAGISFLLVFLKTEIEYGAFALFPIISGICLYFFREYNSSRSGFAADDKQVLAFSATQKNSCSLPQCPSKKETVVFAFCFFASLFFFRFCIGKASFTWIALAGSAGATIESQLFNAVGMLFAAITLIVFIACHKHGVFTRFALCSVIVENPECHLPNTMITTRLIIAINPMKIFARFHAKSKLLHAPESTMTKQTMRNTKSAPLFLVMNKRLLSA